MILPFQSLLINDVVFRLRRNKISVPENLVPDSEMVDIKPAKFALVSYTIRENLYTFLNASYFTGNELLKFDTRHVISVVKVNEDKSLVDDYIRFLINEGQKLIKNQGFTPIME